MNARKHILLLLFFISVFSGIAQTFGNEWIQYNQSYYAFKVYPATLPYYFGDNHGVETGIYKIDYDALVNSGIPVTTFSTENIQIFGREKEVPLFIQDGGDNTMDPGDYILFHTERNDGWIDENLYASPQDVGNPYYNLYNDTLEYFFTWNTSTSNARYVVETDVNFSAYTPNDYIWYKRWQSNTGAYQEGERLSESSSSFYTSGEGWSSGKANGAAGYTWNSSSVELKQIYQGPGAPNVQFKGMQLGLSNANFTGTGNHHVQWTIGASNYSFVDSIWTGYKGILMQAAIPNSIFPASGPSNMKIHIIPDQGAITDYQSISWWSYTYPRIPTFNGENKLEFEVVDHPSQAKIRLDISNISYSSPLVFVHGETPRMIPMVQNGSAHTVLIPNSINGITQKVIFQDAAAVTSVTQLNPVNGNGSFTNFASLNIDSALLMIYHPSMKPAADNYASYRSSQYTVIQANVNELYQQFGGGVEKHINGIRRFAHFIYENSTEKPVGLFLMGKGIREATVGSSSGTRRNTTYFHSSFIPSFGQPSSDICITAGLDGVHKWVPLMATGRISARSNQELQDYLDKVMEYEAQQDPFDVYDSPNKDWQKQVLHFSGGSDYNQQTQFKIYMDGMSSKISDSLFGGNVTSIYKSTSNPLDPTILGSVTDRIEKGVSLMSYFGHASATNSGFEINLDDPINWNNHGKYPVMLVNSCYNGNIYQYGTSKSEEFVQIPGLGAIAYIASVYVGYDIYLNQYSQNLYRHFSYLNYGKTLGDQMKANIQSLEPPTSSLYLETTCTQMVLHGDPMLRLNWHEKPEIELLEEYVWFTPENLDLTMDSIEMHIDLKNLGRSVMDTFSLEVIRNFPESSIDSVYIFHFPKLHYTDNFSFKMPMQANIGLGLNIFSVSVDLPTAISEQYDEIGNNQITKTLFIDVDGIIPVTPYEFAVVPEDSVTVRASTNNPLAAFNTYRFELDTIDFFGASSPAHRYALVSGLGGVKEVHPSQWTLTSNPNGNGTLVCEDSVVYFWRVSVEGDSTWRESSFQYIPNKEGWGQDHFFQFKKNGFSGIDYDRPNRQRNFAVDNKTLQVDVRNGVSGNEYNAYYINGNQQEYGLCGLSPALYVAIIDPITHEPWGTRHVASNQNLGNNFGNINDNTGCRNRVENYFIFPQNSTTGLNNFQNLVNNVVPDGHYILVYTPLQASYTSWNTISPSMYTTFAALGSDSIYPGRPNLPFAFFCRKGDTSSVVEYCAQDNTDDFTMNAILEGFDNIGIEKTPLIGPTSKWGNVYWKQDPMESNSDDTTLLSINVYNLAKTLMYTIDTVMTPNDSILDLNSIVPAPQYPYIDLQAYYVDTNTFTPAQIDRWHVLFDPLPEAAIDGSNMYTWSAINNSTVTEGEPIEFAVDVRNIFSVDMDSLLISYWVEDEHNLKHFINYPRQDSLRVGETLRDTISFSTAGLVGVNSLWMEVNPYVGGTTVLTDQPEQAHFNNLLQIPFYVTEDSINPILDVTFNGNHILNGDIVDPNSEILITLKDDNEFLIMDHVSDTVRFGVYLTNPTGQIKRIPFTDGVGNTVMQWIPANAQNRRFKIVWPAEFTQDGTYTLMVQGTDRSGNISGDIEYKVNFEVIHESSITHMMNYPNPFSTSTRFVFTLTGSEVPDDILIQIMTVTGRVVREITEDQLGPIQIGRNITEYAWNGTDEFGDPLANGVYLYRVKAKINGEDIKHRDSGADGHFKKDFGKMYLFR